MLSALPNILVRLHSTVFIVLHHRTCLKTELFIISVMIWVWVWVMQTVCELELISVHVFKFEFKRVK